MKKNIALAGLLLASSAVMAFGQIADSNVVSDFAKRRASTPALNALNIPSLTDDRMQCLQMLYAYMPLPDLTDRSLDYYLTYAVDPALQARQEMPWGKTVPDDLFRHFVLPIRINNEALDNHRPEFYAELKDRVKGLNMRDAILEINHWCHEKVTYQPSDGRTHSPLQSVSSAIGRCGEESTFTVAALRAMGIPARQVYTPRWAHTDDNHAWVEAWADGKWYFLGACEPEPVLNLGWFNDPASRGMLMHARVFGTYNGPEETLGTLGGNTDVNVTSNYAPVDTLTVTVLNADGTPLKGATVDFRLYNYAELYPITTKTTDAEGRAKMIGGLGDVVAWVSHDGRFNFRQCSIGKDHNVVITLPASKGIKESVVNMLLTPPPASTNQVAVSDAQRAENNRRFAEEDSIRAAYRATFVDSDAAREFANKYGGDADDMVKILALARGNHQTIATFIAEAAPADRNKAIALLKSLTDKDIADVPLAVLRDHLKATDFSSGDMFADYVMSPRIDLEELTPFRSFFNSVITPAEAEAYRTDPTKWAKWVADNIDASASWYPGQVTMSPEAVWKNRTTSARSRDVFFVAGARSMGIPARIDYVTEKTQWADANGQWIDVMFEAPTQTAATPQGTLQLKYTPSANVPDPKYYTHFSLSKIVDGRPQLLNFSDFTPWSEIFKNPQALDAGTYMLVTGQRMANGSVLSQIRFIDVEDGAAAVDSLVVRQDNSAVQVIGSFDAESLYRPEESDEPRSILSTTGRGYYVLGLIKPNDEPSNHALRDIAAATEELNQCGRPIVLLFNSDTNNSHIELPKLESMPANTTFGYDIDSSIAKKIIDGVNLTSNQYPIFIIADTFNRVVFVSQGYTIGLGQQLTDILHRIK